MKLFASLLTATLLVASVFSVQANEAVTPAAKPDLAKGEATYGAVCAACHGADGNSAISANPKLAQQHPDYIVKQLQEFKSGKRANAIMMGMSAALSEQDMKNIAAWLATKTAKKRFCQRQRISHLGRAHLPRWYCRSPNRCVCRLPFTYRCRHSLLVPTFGWAACRLCSGPTHCFP